MIKKMWGGYIDDYLELIGWSKKPLLLLRKKYKEQRYVRIKPLTVTDEDLLKILRLLIKTDLIADWKNSNKETVIEMLLEGINQVIKNFDKGAG